MKRIIIWTGFITIAVALNLLSSSIIQVFNITPVWLLGIGIGLVVAGAWITKGKVL